MNNHARQAALMLVLVASAAGCATKADVLRIESQMQMGRAHADSIAQAQVALEQKQEAATAEGIDRLRTEIRRSMASIEAALGRLEEISGHSQESVSEMMHAVEQRIEEAARPQATQPDSIAAMSSKAAVVKTAEPCPADKDQKAIEEMTAELVRRRNSLLTAREAALSYLRCFNGRSDNMRLLLAETYTGDEGATAADLFESLGADAQAKSARRHALLRAAEVSLALKQEGRARKDAEAVLGLSPTPAEASSARALIGRARKQDESGKEKPSTAEHGKKGKTQKPRT